MRDVRFEILAVQTQGYFCLIRAGYFLSKPQRGLEQHSLRRVVTVLRETEHGHEGHLGTT
jgi:hypothetical protein